MRRIKKQFKYTKVTIADAKTEEVLQENLLSGVVNEEKIATKFIKENGFRPIQISTEEIIELRTMSAETFIEHSELITDESQDEEQEQE